MLIIAVIGAVVVVAVVLLGGRWRARHQRHKVELRRERHRAQAEAWECMLKERNNVRTMSGTG
jgi:FtsZ-interacting cell division protein ZipA